MDEAPALLLIPTHDCVMDEAPALVCLLAANDGGDEPALGVDGDQIR